MRIDGKFDGLSEVLKGLGVDPTTLYRANDAFDLTEEALMEYQTNGAGLKRRTVNVETQLKMAASLVDNPLESNHLAFIGSYPVDTRAKLLGAAICREAFLQTRNHESMSIRMKRPMWISLYNNFLNFDELKKKSPSMLFISNITEESTPQKLERLRDLLEMHANIPRVVMLGTNQDPLSFCTNRLRMSCTHAIMLRSRAVAVSLMTDM